MIPPFCNKRAGFTLIETLVAVTILTLAVAGPLVSASRAYLAARVAADQLAASFLAQEAVEYVRAVRDNVYLADRLAGKANLSTVAWTDFLAGPAGSCRGAFGCSFDPFVGLSVCSSTCTPLGLSSGIYRQGSGTPTRFTRKVVLTTVSATEERVTSTVSWMEHSVPYSVVVVDHLTPWQ